MKIDFNVIEFYKTAKQTEETLLREFKENDDSEKKTIKLIIEILTNLNLKE